MKHQIKSILENVCQQVWSEQDVAKGKIILIEFINGRGIKDADKKKMVSTINEIVSKRKLDQYVANSLLQFEGLSMIKNFAKPEKENAI